MSAKAGLIAAAFSAQLGVEIKSEQDAKKLADQQDVLLVELPVTTIFRQVYNARKIDETVLVLYKNRVELSVDATKTGKEIKIDLAAKLGIDVGRQTLHYQGRRLADDQSVSAQKNEEMKEDMASGVDSDVGRTTRLADDQSVSAQEVSEGARSSLVWDREGDRPKPTYDIVYEDEEDVEDDEDLASQFDHAMRGMSSVLFQETHFEADPSAQRVFEGARSKEVLFFEPVSSKLHVLKRKEIKEYQAPRVVRGVFTDDQSLSAQKVFEEARSFDHVVLTVDTTNLDNQPVSAQRVPSARGFFERSIWSLFKWSCGDGPKQIYVLPDKDLDPQYDFDFTNITDVGWKFERGGHEYKRPCGWERCALKVRGRYSDDVWLGEPGCRTRSSPGEWAVSYHGTGEGNIGSIAGGGYDTSKSRRQAYGPGIYSTPSIEVASAYAKEFTYGGKQYKVVLQNRVDLTGGKTRVIPAAVTGAGAEYFVTLEEDNVRPYGVCTASVAGVI